MLEYRYDPAVRKRQKSKKDGKQMISIMTRWNEDILKRKYVSQSEYQTRTGVWQAAPHLDWDCLDGHTLGLLFKPQSHF